MTTEKYTFKVNLRTRDEYHLENFVDSLFKLQLNSIEMSILLIEEDGFIRDLSTVYE